MDLNLKGRVAVITGGGKGVGAGISRVLAAEGVKVMINYNSNPDMAIKHAQNLRDMGGIVEVFQANVADRKQVDAMMKHTAEVFGGIDIVVNNAAWQPNYDIDEYTEEQYDEIMQVNLGGYFRCTQSALPYLKKSNAGRVIMISSVHGKRPNDFDVCYSMSKGGIKMLVREAALELAKYGITVNAILPGGVKIEFKSGFHQLPKVVDRPVTREYGIWPLQRVCEPDEVGNLVGFIASDVASYLTGTSIRLDGGTVLL